MLRIASLPARAWLRRSVAFAAAFFAAAGLRAAPALATCRIAVVEKGTGWPVPMVFLRTTSGVEFVTDNAGVAAFDLPECMGRETWLEISSDGYRVEKDGFGYRGARILPTPGGAIRIEVERTSLAKRLGRLTGSGLFGESQKVGERLDWKESGVTGSDTVQMTRHGGRLFWLWGDTGIFSYPLGIFDSSSATTPADPLPSPKPPVGLVYEYFRDEKGALRGVTPMPGKGPTWASGYVSLRDRAGKEHLVCLYSKIPAYLTPGEFGLAEWNETAKRFDALRTLWRKSPKEPRQPELLPDGHPAIWTDARGEEWLYFGGPPSFKCPATFEAWKDPSTWRAVAQPKEFATVDGGTIRGQAGAIAWSGYRKRWILILQQRDGKPSPLGEIWYLEGRTPEGPWGRAIKVLSHENHTFYNPQIDWQLTPAGSPVLLFEGTYTAEFSSGRKTPRYDYNQILYRLDLDDPALAPAHLP